jgi:hypothetical protein
LSTPSSVDYVALIVQVETKFELQDRCQRIKLLALNRPSLKLPLSLCPLLALGPLHTSTGVMQARSSFSFHPASHTFMLLAPLAVPDFQYQEDFFERRSEAAHMLHLPPAPWSAECWP